MCLLSSKKAVANSPAPPSTIIQSMVLVILHSEREKYHLLVTVSGRSDYI